MESTGNGKHLLFYSSLCETATAIVFGFHYYGCKYSLSLGLIFIQTIFLKKNQGNYFHFRC